jgi:hypothetical protein
MEDDQNDHNFINKYEGYDVQGKCKYYSYPYYDFKKDEPLCVVNILYVDYEAAL